MAQTHPQTIKARLDGPVNSIPTPFLANGDIDIDGVRNIIDVGIAGGSEVSLLTYGDSQFDHLSDEEVAELTRCLIDQVKGRTAPSNDRVFLMVEFPRFELPVLFFERF